MFKLTLCMVLSVFVWAEDCIHGSSSHISVRHRDPKGMGYNSGYTTLEAFLTPNWDRAFQPFFDARFHLLNNTRLATNVGGGMRFALPKQLVVGANGYFDFRDAKDLRSHQIAGGLELLHPVVDWRLNGYLPVGRKHSKDHPEVASINGNTIAMHQRITQNMPHIETLLGAWTPKTWPIDIYASAGPYYLLRESHDGAKCGKAWGVKTVLEMTVLDGLILGGQWTYDREFHGKPQGYASLSFPFGPSQIRRGGKRWNKWYSNCKDKEQTIRQRIMTGPVRRDEIIPLCNTFVPVTSTQDEICIFVDNTAPSGGDGTFAFPFNSLAEAQASSGPGDCIYVVYGTGDSTFYDQGIVLQQGQFLQGSGTDFIMNGMLVLPAQTPGQIPIITNINSIAGAGNGVTLANNVQIDGFEIADIGNGITSNAAISGFSTSNVTVRNSTIQNNNRSITLAGAGGQISFINNTIRNTTGSDSIFITSDPNITFLMIGNLIDESLSSVADVADVRLDSSTIILTNNTFIPPQFFASDAVFETQFNNSANDSTFISRNNMFIFTGQGVVFARCLESNLNSSTGGSLTFVSDGDVCIHDAGVPGLVLFLNSSATGIHTGTIQNGSVTTPLFSTTLVEAAGSDTSSSYVKIDTNTLSAGSILPGRNAIEFRTSDAGTTICANVTGNTLTFPVSFNALTGTTITVEAASAAAVSTSNSGVAVLTPGAGTVFFDAGANCVP